MDKQVMKGVFLNGVFNENPTFRRSSACARPLQSQLPLPMRSVWARQLFVLTCSNMLISPAAEFYSGQGKNFPAMWW